MLYSLEYKREEKRDEPLGRRSEGVNSIHSCANGVPVVKPAHYDIKGWPPGDAERFCQDSRQIVLDLQCQYESEFVPS